MSEEKVPTSFRKLNKEQLEAACDFFGSEKGNLEEMRANLADDGITWKQYAEAFNLPVGDNSDETPTNVVTSNDVQQKEDKVAEVVTVTERPVLAQAEKYLIRFIGQNPYFEFGRYKFTQEAPYAIMPAEDAQRALTEEQTKFRQAFPKELQEFYDR